MVHVRNFPEPPTTGISSKVLSVQMGGVLRCGWRVYCSTNGRCTALFPFLQSLEASKAQRYKWGAYCGTHWGCAASAFRAGCAGWGFLGGARRALGLCIAGWHGISSTHISLMRACRSCHPCSLEWQDGHHGTSSDMAMAARRTPPPR